MRNPNVPGEAPEFVKKRVKQMEDRMREPAQATVERAYRNAQGMARTHLESTLQREGKFGSMAELYEHVSMMREEAERLGEYQGMGRYGQMREALDFVYGDRLPEQRGEEPLDFDVEMERLGAGVLATQEFIRRHASGDGVPAGEPMGVEHRSPDMIFDKEVGTVRSVDLRQRAMDRTQGVRGGVGTQK